MTKKTVAYDQSKGVKFVAFWRSSAERAIIWPLDHPDKGLVSNEHEAITSPVVKKNDDGSFETMNSIYVPGVRA